MVTLQYMWTIISHPSPSKTLSMLNIGCTGTIRSNMIQVCPLPTKADFKKSSKGLFEAYEDDNSGVKLCMWNDNGPFTATSNFGSVFPTDFAKRWSCEKKAEVSVERPGLISSYNQYVGGTDQMDQAIACYRKWYWPLFSNVIQISCYNSWQLLRTLENNIPFLHHLRSLARS